MIITIDGPTASGKSTVARLLADKLGFTYLNTGLLYRALAHVLLTQYDYTLEVLAHPLRSDVRDVLLHIIYSYEPCDGASVIYMSNDITPLLKTPLIDKGSSVISQDEYVREKILDLERASACGTNIIVEGRDCGSVAFPQAEYKFFLTAAVGIRAQRWQEDQARRGIPLSFDQAEAFIQERDARDSTREVSPLIIPKGAHVVDNSSMSPAETVIFIRHLLV